MLSAKEVKNTKYFNSIIGESQALKIEKGLLRKVKELAKEWKKE